MDFNGLLQNPMFHIGMGLLSNSGPSLVPKSPFQGIGTGLQSYMLALQNAQRQEKEDKQFEMQQELQRARLEQIEKQNQLAEAKAGAPIKVGKDDILLDPTNNYQPFPGMPQRQPEFGFGSGESGQAWNVIGQVENLQRQNLPIPPELAIQYNNARSILNKDERFTDALGRLVINPGFGLPNLLGQPAPQPIQPNVPPSPLSPPEPPTSSAESRGSLPGAKPTEPAADENMFSFSRYATPPPPVSLPGGGEAYEPIDPKKGRQAALESTNLANLVQQYRNEVETNGTEIMTGPIKGRMLALEKKILVTVKTLEGLGVLSAQDEEIVKGMFPSATSFGDAAKNFILGMGDTDAMKDQMIAQIDQSYNNLFNSLKTNAELYRGPWWKDVSLPRSLGKKGPTGEDNEQQKPANAISYEEAEAELRRRMQNNQNGLLFVQPAGSISR